MAVNLYFMGTAGSGKTTLTKEFKVWMESQGYDDVTVNLDPGVEALPYDVDIDIRDWVSLHGVMEEHGLGPNGAQIVCSDMIAMHAKEVRQVMDEYQPDYFLIDTPGQMELFTFREASKEIVKTLGDKSMITFLMDPVLSKQPSGFVSLLLLASTTQFRFSVPYLPVISKADLLKDEDIEKIQRWGEDMWELDSALREKSSEETHVGLELIKALQNMGITKHMPKVSSAEKEGFEEIYTAVQDSFFGGEDLRTD